jgi:dolichol-phosphate mannosyltransferase
MQKKIISIVVPTYNEVDNVGLLCEKLAEIFDQQSKYIFEVIFIDNASTDDTVPALKAIAATDKRIKIVVNNRNFGTVRSPYWGLLQSQGDASIIMAADFQDPPELIPDLISKWESGTKIVLAAKPVSKGNVLMHTIRRVYYILLNKFSDIELARDTTGFGIYDKEVVEQLRRINDPYPYFRGLIQEFGYSISTIDYLQPRRIRGVTKNNFYTLYDMAMLGMISHSILPIRLASMLGFFIGFISFILALAVLVAKLVWWESFIGGQAGLLILILLLFGTLLIFIGMLGEYVGSIHNYLKNRPIVVEKERVNFNNDKGD